MSLLAGFRSFLISLTGQAKVHGLLRALKRVQFAATSQDYPRTIRQVCCCAVRVALFASCLQVVR